MCAFLEPWRSSANDRRKQPKEPSDIYVSHNVSRTEHTRLEHNPLRGIISKLGAIHSPQPASSCSLVGLRHGRQSIHGSGVKCLFCLRR